MKLCICYLKTNNFQNEYPVTLHSLYLKTLIWPFYLHPYSLNLDEIQQRFITIYNNLKLCTVHLPQALSLHEIHWYWRSSKHQFYKPRWNLIEVHHNNNIKLSPKYYKTTDYRYITGTCSVWEALWSIYVDIHVNPNSE